MVRRITEKDRDEYLKMTAAFYETDAVAKKIPEEFRIGTFEELMRSDVYAQAYILEADGQTAGYALLSKTFSQEAGGMVVWIEELFMKDSFRGRGLGKEFFQVLFKEYGDTIRRFRLEVEPENETAVALYKKLGFDYMDYAQMKLGE